MSRCPLEPHPRFHCQTLAAVEAERASSRSELERLQGGLERWQDRDASDGLAAAADWGEQQRQRAERAEARLEECRAELAAVAITNTSESGARGKDANGAASGDGANGDAVAMVEEARAHPGGYCQSCGALLSGSGYCLRGCHTEAARLLRERLDAWEPVVRLAFGGWKGACCPAEPVLAECDELDRLLDAVPEEHRPGRREKR